MALLPTRYHLIGWFSVMNVNTKLKVQAMGPIACGVYLQLLIKPIYKMLGLFLEHVLPWVTIPSRHELDINN